MKTLNELIKESGISKTHISKKLEISQSALYSRISNPSMFRTHEAYLLWEMLGKDIGWEEFTKIFLSNNLN